jgi:hypothetical protein
MFVDDRASNESVSPEWTIASVIAVVSSASRPRITDAIKSAASGASSIVPAT